MTKCSWSLPSRERGLKCRLILRLTKPGGVAPFTGAWIEIKTVSKRWGMRGVAPFTGAWIEMAEDQCGRYPGGVAPFTGAWIEICRLIPSPPSICVAPFTGAWIEIVMKQKHITQAESRSLHGSVD